MLRKVTGPLLVLVFLFLLYWRPFVWLVHSWLSSPYYGHGFLVPLIAGYIAWTKRGELQRTAPSWAGVVLLGLGLLLYLLGFIRAMIFLSAISLLPVLAGLVLYFYGPRGVRTMTFPLCFLLFMIPPPFISEVGYWLQYLSAHGSAWLVQVFGLPTTLTGAEIQLGDSTFVVGLPCSGMNTLIALLALAAIFIYLLRGSFYKKVILFILAFPLAILANVFRISSLLLVANHLGAEAAEGFFHGFSSLLFFLLAFLGLAGIAKAFGCSLALRSGER